MEQCNVTREPYDKAFLIGEAIFTINKNILSYSYQKKYFLA